MTGRSSRRTAAEDFPDLAVAIKQLADQVRLLTRVVDELLTEVQWQNNQRCRSMPVAPFALNSLPADPAANDWQINRVEAADASPLSPGPRRSQPQTLFD